MMGFLFRGRRKWFSLVILLTLAGLAGTVWLQDRPLREADRLLAAGNPRAALKLVEDWESAHQPTGKSQALLARCYVALGRYSRGIAIFEESGAQTPEEMHAWATAHLHLEQWSRALPLLEFLQEKNPDDADVLHELSACQAKLGLVDDALETARQFATHEEFAHRAWLLIGALLREKGNKEKARDAWLQIAQYDPEYGDIQIPAEEFLTQFASLEIELGNLASAETLLEKALHRNPPAETHFQAGLLAELQGKSEIAKKHWQQAIARDKGHINARESLARMAIAARDGRKAKDYLRPLIADPAIRSSTTYLLNRTALLLGEEEDAKKWEEKTRTLRQREKIDAAVVQLLRDSPESFWANIVRAYQFAEQENWEEAETILNRVRADQNDSPFVRGLARSVKNRKPPPPLEQLPITLF